MSNNISQDITPPPLILQYCLINGRINLPRYYWYKRRRDDEQHSIRLNECVNQKKIKHDVVVKPTGGKQKIIRSVKKHRVLVRDSDGTYVN